MRGGVYRYTVVVMVGGRVRGGGVACGGAGGRVRGVGCTSIPWWWVCGGLLAGVRGAGERVHECTMVVVVLVLVPALLYGWCITVVVVGVRWLY